MSEKRRTVNTTGLATPSGSLVYVGEQRDPDGILLVFLNFMDDKDRAGRRVRNRAFTKKVSYDGVDRVHTHLAISVEAAEILHKLLGDKLGK